MMRQEDALKKKRKDSLKVFKGLKQLVVRLQALLGNLNPNKKRRQKNRRRPLANKKDKEKKQKNKQDFETHVEAPHGIESGPSLFIKFKRRKNPLRGAPRATAELRSAETRTNRE